MTNEFFQGFHLEPKYRFYYRIGLVLQCNVSSLVVSLIGEGEKIHQLKMLCVKQEGKHFIVMFCVLLNVPIKFENSINGMVCPGRKILLSVFLQNVWKHELYYQRRMHEIGISNDWICCDHTFKSVMNVGI